MLPTTKICSPDRFIAHVHLAGCLLGVAALLLAGCAGTSPLRTNKDKDVAIDVAGKPVGQSTSAVIVDGTRLGAIRFNELTLPLVSPNGRYVAVESGIAPSWSVILAHKEAPLPRATYIEVYRLEAAGRPPQPVASIDGPILLGRSCDADGFVIEAPQKDGSRWIGKAAWTTGEVTWFVQDENVNAFATLGPDGRLAWSRRAKDDDLFELVVRHNGEQWTRSIDVGEWLFPMWSGYGSGLFALYLDTDGDLGMCHMRTDSEVASEQSTRAIELSYNSTRYHAFQTIASNVVCIGSTAPMRDEIIFFHPGAGRQCPTLWRPLDRSDKPLVYFDADQPSSRRASMGVIADKEYVLLSRPEELARRRIDNYLDVRPIFEGQFVVRRTASSDWPFVLMTPTRQGELGLLGVKLLPVQ